MRNRLSPNVDPARRISEPEFQSVGRAHLLQTRIAVRVAVELVLFDGRVATAVRRYNRVEHRIKPYAADKRADDRAGRAAHCEIIPAPIRLEDLVREHAVPRAPQVGEGADAGSEPVFHRIDHATAFAAVDVDIGARIDGGRAAHDKFEIVFLLAPRAIQSVVDGGTDIDVLGIGDNQIHHDGVLLSWITVRSKPNPFHCTWCSPAGNGWKI